MPDTFEPVSPSTENQKRKDASLCPVLLQEHLKEHDMFTSLEMDAEFRPPSDSLQNCLKLFTSLDILDEDNKFICDNCTAKMRKNPQEVCFYYVAIYFLKWYLSKMMKQKAQCYSYYGNIVDLYS